MDSDHYEFGGKCLPFDVLTRTNSWVPTAADQTPPASETLTALRTKLGIVVARAKIDGKPYAYTQLRDTYFHEVDPSALGFATSTTRARCARPRTSCRRRTTSPTRSTGSTSTTSTSPTSTRAPTRCGPSNVDPNLPTFGTEAVPVEGLRPEHRDRGRDAAVRASARDRPALPDELEQPAGAGLQHRLLVAVPLAAARRADQARHRGRARRSTSSG